MQTFDLFELGGGSIESFRRISKGRRELLEADAAQALHPPERQPRRILIAHPHGRCGSFPER
jgi:hypothetical protein